MRGETRKLALAALMTALTAVGGFVRVPAGITSITMQTFFTALAGLLLPGKWAAASQGVYVALGLLGLPVFTQGGGIGYVVQPTFGFLLASIPAAAVVARVAGENPDARRVAAAVAAGYGVMYLIGLPYMALILKVYLAREVEVWTVVKVGCLACLPGDCGKIAALAATAPRIRRGLARR